MIDSWRSSIAHADLADWVTVAAYLIAAFLAGRSAQRARPPEENLERWFWRFTAVLLAFLAVNELLDLQTLLTAVGRAYARADGWYEDRRSVQFVFVLALGAAGLVTSIVLCWLTRTMDGAVRLAVVGLMFIGIFVLFRAASFHHLDVLFSRGTGPFNWGSLQEIAGIMIVLAAAARYAQKRRIVNKGS